MENGTSKNLDNVSGVERQNDAGLQAKKPDKLKIIQINLNNCRAASTTLANHIKDNQIDIALLQDAHLNADKKPTGFYTDWIIFSSKRSNAHVLISNKHLNYAHLFSGPNSIFITLTTDTGQLFLGSTYVAPKTDFDQAIEEWEHIITQNKYFICGGDFNANSQLWGYPHENRRGDLLTEHIIINRLVIANTEGSSPTYVQKNSDGDILAEGWPDLTLTNPLTYSKIKNWQVSDLFTASDHNYILIDFETNPVYNLRKRFNTTRGNKSKFARFLKAHKQPIQTELKRVSNTEDLNNATNTLISLMQAAARSTFRYKSIKKTPTY